MGNVCENEPLRHPWQTRIFGSLY